MEKPWGKASYSVTCCLFESFLGVVMRALVWKGWNGGSWNGLHRVQYCNSVVIYLSTWEGNRVAEPWLLAAGSGIWPSRQDMGNWINYGLLWQCVYCRHTVMFRSWNIGLRVATKLCWPVARSVCYNIDRSSGHAVLTEHPRGGVLGYGSVGLDDRIPGQNGFTPKWPRPKRPHSGTASVETSPDQNGPNWNGLTLFVGYRNGLTKMATTITAPT